MTPATAGRLFARLCIVAVVLAWLVGWLFVEYQIARLEHRQMACEEVRP